MGMTNKEAVETIKTAIAQVEWDYPMDYAAAFNMAVEALGNQEPKPPRFTGESDKIFYACYKCWKPLLVMIDEKGVYSVANMPKYCPECGQAVKWE